MSFMALPPSIPPGTAPAPPAAAPGIIENDGWFPDVNLAEMRDAMRLDGTVTDARLVQAVVDAILQVNRELAQWQGTQAQAGIAALVDVPATRINRESRLLAQYRRAVYSTAKADLIERYRDYDSTATSVSDKKSMEWLDEAPGAQRRNAQWAIADMVGRTHLTVELI
ncbi:head completion/stabilization protein [Janthinobacterium agaricidamnosum]|uniref:Head completion/stabilization protein n=1 Tax=Janthinobacterium agaricidamnosum TaxID=55508 RepID=A0A3G2EFX3_9BURK|nr:head completion/stabilization protein [Janthinobacterium agaricidamnosum]AYM78586.1 head completion/stabilization protein [Janthinobacterium agaricidamnosum]